MIKGNFVIAISDAHGHMHLMYTEVESEEEIKKLQSLISNWNPKETDDRYISSKEIFDSLKNLTGYQFYYYKPDFYRKYGSIVIGGDTTYDW